jgi:hypothetical protein
MMEARFQIRVDGAPVESYDTEAEAEAAARDLKGAVGEQLVTIRDQESGTTKIVQAL